MIRKTDTSSVNPLTNEMIMKTLKNKIQTRKSSLAKPSDVFRNEDGAIDLSSIMVGVIVIGLIGGVIAATVFAVIPWTQDNAAKQQLDSITSAESAYMGMSSAIPSPLAAGYVANSFANSAQLAAANLLQTGPSYCVSTPADGKSYTAFSQSASGQVFSTTDKNSQPVTYSGALTTDCGFITSSTTAPSSASQAAWVDPTPTVTSLTYNCPTTTTGSMPMNGNLNGTEKWNDTAAKTLTNAANGTSRTLSAGVTYTVSFTGTYTSMNSLNTGLFSCLRSVDHWGMNSGVTTAADGFYSATNLTSVPDHIPATITNLNELFYNTSKLNDPNISKWDVSHVTNFDRVFWNSSFNQPLNDWNTSNGTSMFQTFMGATAFNQPLDKWNTSKVTRMSNMFTSSNFNQPLNTWDISNVTDISGMFSSNPKFDQPLDKWNTSKVTMTASMFAQASAFNQDISGWDMSHVTRTDSMFQNATAFKGDLSKWNTTNVTNMYQMFYSSNFTGDISGWNVAKVTDMRSMFLGNPVFNTNLHSWNTASLLYGTTFARANFTTAYLPPKTSL